MHGRLRTQGSSLQWKTCLGWTPLHFAAMQSNVQLVDWMLSEGSDALATGEDGCMPGDCATHPDVRRTLFKTGAPPPHAQPRCMMLALRPGSEYAQHTV